MVPGFTLSRMSERMNGILSAKGGRARFRTVGGLGALFLRVAGAILFTVCSYLTTLICGLCFVKVIVPRYSARAGLLIYRLVFPLKVW